MASQWLITRQEKHDLRAEALQILTIPSTDRTSAQTARLNAIEARMIPLDKEIDALAAQMEIDRKTVIPGEAPPPAHPARGKRFAEMFPTVARDMGGFASSNEYLQVLHSGLSDPRLMAASTGAVPSEGGFSVPAEVFSGWLDTSLENELIRPLADVRPMLGQEASAPGWDAGDRTSKLFGGFTGQWVPEAGTITVETPKMRLITLKARKLAILMQISNELIADGQDFDSQLGAAITAALGWFLDKAFLFGTGAAEPLGILNAPCTVTVAKELSQTAGTVVYLNLAKMYARLTPGSHERAVWLANSTLIPSLLCLSIPAGAGALPAPFAPVMNETSGKFTIFGRPVYFSEKLNTAGTAGDLILADLSQYLVGVRANFSLAKSGHAGFQDDTSYYRGLIRVDGQPKLNAPITPHKGVTVSPFVVLEART
jgi:HK97 family phage major capsid protein